MEFAYGFIAGGVLIRIIYAFSQPFKDDLIGQQIVYDKGYNEGYQDGKFEKK